MNLQTFENHINRLNYIVLNSQEQKFKNEILDIRKSLEVYFDMEEIDYYIMCDFGKNEKTGFYEETPRQLYKRIKRK